MAGSSTADRKKPGPQPRGPYSDKRKTLSTRITVETRRQLDKAAKDSGRSLAQEVELRLDRSFQRDDADDRVREAVWADVRNMFGGKRKFVLMRLTAR